MSSYIATYKENQPTELCIHMIHYFKVLTEVISQSGLALLYCPRDNVLCQLNSRKNIISLLRLFFSLKKASLHFNKTFSFFPSLTRNLEIGFMFS